MQSTKRTVETQNFGRCKSCKSDFVYQPENTWFDEHGYGYSTKLTKCPYCKKIVVLKHIEDRGLNVNFDDRYYK